MFCTLTLIASSLTHFPVLYRSFQVYFHTPPILMVHSSHVGYIILTSRMHMNTTTKSLLRVGNSELSLSLEFLSWGRVSEKTCRMQWTQTKICSIGEVIDMNKIIFFIVMYYKTI